MSIIGLQVKGLDKYQMFLRLLILQILTVDIEKTFDSTNHSFLLCVLKKFECGTEFINLIKALMKNSESRIINDGKATTYFKLKRGDQTRRPDFSISLHLSISSNFGFNGSSTLKACSSLVITSYTLLVLMTLLSF